MSEKFPVFRFRTHPIVAASGSEWTSFLKDIHSLTLAATKSVRLEVLSKY
jgi:hypothetical protein